MKMARLRVAQEQKPEEPSREDRFILILQEALERDLKMSGSLDTKERNALYANCVKFLAVLTKFGGNDDDGSFFDN